MRMNEDDATRKNCWGGLSVSTHKEDYEQDYRRGPMNYWRERVVAMSNGLEEYPEGGFGRQWL